MKLRGRLGAVLSDGSLNGCAAGRRTTPPAVAPEPRAALAAKNLAPCQQVAVLQRSVKRPRLRRRDRIFWVWLSRLWRGWRSSLIVVQPETVLRWHREGFRLYWRWKSRKRCGRPKLDAEIRALIRRMSRDNPTYVKWTEM